jgi:hypothetical protein
MVCKKCNVTLKVVSWDEVKKHIDEHGDFTEQEVAEIKEAFEHEVRMASNPYEAYVGVSELEALGVSPDEQYIEDCPTECSYCGGRGVINQQGVGEIECPVCDGGIVW